MNKLKSVKTKLGNTVELIGEPDSKNPVLIIGVFHGDEPQGKYLIEKYLFQPPLPNPPPQGGREFKKQQYSLFAKIKSKELRKNMTDTGEGGHREPILSSSLFFFFFSVFLYFHLPNIILVFPTYSELQM